MRSAASFIFICLFLSPFQLQSEPLLQPHRAYYALTMAERPGLASDVADVRGTMMVEMTKVADGWTVQQILEIWKYADEEAIEHVRSGYATWEAEDGSLFKFNAFEKVNDELVENVRGIVQKNGKQKQVFFQKPERKTLSLPEGTLFPIEYLKALLAAAQKGDHVFSQVVFEGKELQGASEFNTFIGPKKSMEGMKLGKGAPQFANQAFWPIRTSTYGVETADYNPDSVKMEDMLPNGIITKFTLDDGDIKIKGTLERVELLK